MQAAASTRVFLAKKDCQRRGYEGGEVFLRKQRLEPPKPERKPLLERGKRVRACVCGNSAQQVSLLGAVGRRPAGKGKESVHKLRARRVPKENVARCVELAYRLDCTKHALNDGKGPDLAWIRARWVLALQRDERPRVSAQTRLGISQGGGTK